MAEKATDWKQWKPLAMKVGAILAAIVLGWLARMLGVPPEVIEKVVEVEKPVVVATIDAPGADVAPHINTTGWVNDREEIESAALALPVQRFSQTPAGQVAALPKSVYLWKFYETLFGRPPPEKDQNPTGSCVGFGTTTAVERTLAAEIVLRRGSKDEFSHFSEEVTYAGSRFEALGNRPPGFRGDGSNGSWAAKFVTQWGMVPKAVYGSLDLREYSASRARSWNNTGVPDHLEPTARKFPVKSAARITNWEDAKKALASGYGIQVASSMAVARERDANGVARPQGSWAHSMCLDGYHTDDNGTEYGHVENSWSKVKYHTGPVGWGNPTGAGFWVRSETLDRALREGDSYAYSGATGFPARVLPAPPDWFIQAHPKRDRDPFARFARPEFALAP